MTPTRRHEPLRLRIYGESITLRRNQWEELLEDMRPDTDNARRIRELLGPDCATCNDTGYAENIYDGCAECAK